MKILSLGLDNSVLNQSSAPAGRVIEYGLLVSKYTIIVPNSKTEIAGLSANVSALGSGGTNKPAQFINIYNLAKKLLKQDKYDIITVQDQYYLALIGLKLAKKFKLGLEIQVHGFEKFSGLRRLIAKYVLPRADSVRCVSQRLKKMLISDFNVKEEKITVVPIYAQRITHNLPTGQAGAQRIKRQDKNFIFLTVGRLVPVKNISLQIEALEEVTKAYQSVELWIVGEGSERIKLEQEIRNFNLGKYVTLLGWKDDVDQYYNQADAFLLTSNSEGWGLAITGAAWYSLPIIMTDVGCAGEVIKNGESGLIIPVGDKEKLAKAMIKIVQDEPLGRKLGQNAKSAVYSLPTKEQTLDLYKKSWQQAMKK